MEDIVRFISDKYVYDGTSFQKVMKRGFKEVQESQFKKWAGMNCPDALVSFAEIKKALYTRYLILADQFSQEVADEYADVPDFIKKELLEKGIFDVKANGTIIMSGDATTLKQQLKLKIDKHNKSVGNTDLSLAMIDPALDVVVEEIKLNKLEELRGVLRYDERIEVDWNKLIKIMRVDTTHPVHGDMTEHHINALKHIVWQVKRKLYGLDVVWHLCFILYGKQGCGKSDFLKRLFKPVEEVYMLIDGESVSDKFGGEIFHNHFVGNIDELTKVGDKSIELIKQFITSDKRTGRQIFSQSHLETKQNMTLVGSSNRPINKAIRDFSGMRRWWQSDIDKLFRTMDFEGIEATDFLSFWKSIDETKEGFYSSKDKVMEEYQDSFKQISSCEEFADYEGYSFDYTCEIKYISLSEIYEEYKLFCRRNNYKPIRYNEFRNSLIELGFEVSSKRVGTRRKYAMKVAKNDYDEFE